MAKTNSEVISQALALIGVKPIGQAVSGEDYAATLVHLNQVLENLDEQHELAMSFTADAFPDWAHLPLANMVAGSVCPVFELPQFAGLYAKGLRQIKAKRAADTYVPTPAVYY